MGNVNYYLGERIQNVRKKKGFTQAQLSEAVDISQGYLSDIESGKELPGRDVLFKLCEALDVGLDYLYYGERSKRNPRLEKMLDWIEKQDEEIQDIMIGYVESVIKIIEIHKQGE
ncbi:MAG: helix-turn-helix transcriptional regulator [Firmicutes bacterium]|jgi:transcriptional regulator with XRE-family HTH domain|nr:helix-turn-helix transcriptional regulator [Bacillota bacterium]